MKYNDNKKAKNSKLKVLSVVGSSSLLALSAFALNVPAIYAPLNVLADQSAPFSTVTVENGDFSSTSTSTFPQTANTWKVLTDNSGIKAGVVSLTSGSINNNYKDYGLFNNNNNLVEENNTNAFLMNAMENPAIYGIQSGDISFDANSNYVLRFKVRTSLEILKDENTGKKIESSASAYLLIDDEIVTSQTNITTNGDWITYSFFIKTSFEAKSTAHLQLYLGSKGTANAGAVLFKSVTCIKCTDSYYDTIKSRAVVGEHTEYISAKSLENPTYKARVDVTDILTDPDFADTSVNPPVDPSTHWTKDTYGDASIINSGIIDNTSHYINDNFLITPPLLNNKATDPFVLAMSILQDEDKSASVTYSSEPFTISRYTNYLIQFYVKTQDISGNGLHASVVPTDNKYNTITLSSITSTTQATTNNWTLCSIYVQGDSFSDVEVKLEFGLGSVTNKNTASGRAFVDNISIFKTSYATYANAETSSTITKGTIYSSSSSSDSKVANPNFDIVATTAGETLPFTPANWTANNTYNEASGIINNKKYTGQQYGLSWDAIGLTKSQDFIDNDHLDIANQNLLMIRTGDAGYQSYTSDSIELSASTLYKLSVEAKNLSSTNAYITLSFDNETIYTTEIVQSTNFELYDIYIITPMSSVNATIELGLGSPDNIVAVDAHAFFDNIYLTDLSASESDKTPEELLEELKEDDADLIALNFKSDYFAYNSNAMQSTGLYDTLSWVTPSATNVRAGISSTNESLKIVSDEPTTNYEVTAKYTCTLDSSKYYKVAFTLNTSAFTNLIGDNGATIGFVEKTGEKEFFSNIISSEEEQTYTFYINATNVSSLTPYVKLITNNSSTEQFVEITDLTIEEITEATYKAKQTEIEGDESITNVIMLGATTEEDSESDDQSKNNNQTTDASIWSWVIPTITTCLAILLAIIGLIVKRIKRKESKKGKKYLNNYDRTSTIQKSLIDREVEKLRQEKIDEVTKKLLATQEKLQNLEDNYKDTISDENANKEAEYKKLVRNRKKHAQKEIELKEELDYLKSDDYTDTARAEIAERELAKFDENSVIEKTDVVEEVVDVTEAQSTQEVAEQSQQEETTTESNKEDK